MTWQDICGWSEVGSKTKICWWPVGKPHNCQDEAKIVDAVLVVMDKMA